jgi:hypothetical protein
MKLLKLFFLWMVITLVMIISWSVGAWIGNFITATEPPPVEDPAAVGIAVMLVCLANSLVWSILFWSTRGFGGQRRWLTMLLFLFGTQFFLMQMETLFFSSSLTISPAQVVSILVAGLVMVSASGAFGLWLTRKLSSTETRMRLHTDVRGWREMLIPMLLLSALAYPLLYQVFGYYVAWQNEHLRMFYSESTELKPFLTELSAFFSSGLYFFQVLRAMLWVGISIPVVQMLGGQNKFFQYVFFALLCALPSIQLFIPNPYMPADIAMSHFAETASSNFLWGLVIVYTTNEWMTQAKTGTITDQVAHV